MDIEWPYQGADLEAYEAWASQRFGDVATSGEVRIDEREETDGNRTTTTI